MAMPVINMRSTPVPAEYMTAMNRLENLILFGRIPLSDCMDRVFSKVVMRYGKNDPSVWLLLHALADAAEREQSDPQRMRAEIFRILDAFCASPDGGMAA